MPLKAAEGTLVVYNVSYTAVFGLMVFGGELIAGS